MKNTTLCYIERDGQYLMLYRNKKKNDVNHGKWIGVGGKCEEGESPEDCLVREVKEETGYTLASFTPRGLVTFLTDNGENEYMFLYTAKAADAGDVPPPCDEGELRWIDKTAVPSLPLWEGDRIFLSLLAEDVPYFSLKLVYCGKDDVLTEAFLNGKPLDLPTCP